jgi:hypothetical protein
MSTNPTTQSSCIKLPADWYTCAHHIYTGSHHIYTCSHHIHMFTSHIHVLTSYVHMLTSHIHMFTPHTHITYTHVHTTYTHHIYTCSHHIYTCSHHIHTCSHHIYTCSHHITYTHVHTTYTHHIYTYTHVHTTYTHSHILYRFSILLIRVNIYWVWWKNFIVQNQSFAPNPEKPTACITLPKTYCMHNTPQHTSMRAHTRVHDFSKTSIFTLPLSLSSNKQHSKLWKCKLMAFISYSYWICNFMYSLFWVEPSEKTFLSSAYSTSYHHLWH